MAGAAAVLAAIAAAAALGLPVRRHRLAGARREHAVAAPRSGPATCITIYGGTTVEVLNTDAEGRLVLADALVAASEDDPDLIIDVATLTGAQMVALGAGRRGDGQRRRLRDAGASTRPGSAGEQLWPMPLPDGAAHRPGLSTSPTSPTCGEQRRHAGRRPVPPASSSARRPTAAVQRSPGRTWTSPDRPSTTGRPYGYTPRAAPARPVRTLVELAEDVAGPGEVSRRPGVTSPSKWDRMASNDAAALGSVTPQTQAGRHARERRDVARRHGLRHRHPRRRQRRLRLRAARGRSSACASR